MQKEFETIEAALAGTRTIRLKVKKSEVGSLKELLELMDMGSIDMLPKDANLASRVVRQNECFGDHLLLDVTLTDACDEVAQSLLAMFMHTSCEESTIITT